MNEDGFHYQTAEPSGPDAAPTNLDNLQGWEETGYITDTPEWCSSDLIREDQQQTEELRKPYESQWRQLLEPALRLTQQDLEKLPTPNPDKVHFVIDPLRHPEETTPE